MHHESSTGCSTKPQISEFSGQVSSSVFSAQEPQEDSQLHRRARTPPRLQREGGNISEGGGMRRGGSISDCRYAVSCEKNSKNMEVPEKPYQEDMTCFRSCPNGFLGLALNDRTILRKCGHGHTHTHPLTLFQTTVVIHAVEPVHGGNDGSGRNHFPCPRPATDDKEGTRRHFYNFVLFSNRL